MLMADTMAIFFATVGLLVSLVGLWLLARGLWPDRSDAAAARLERGLVGPFLAGVPLALAAAAAAAVVANLGGRLGGLGAVAIACLFFTYSSVGVSGLATLVGRRLRSADDEASPWRATLRGGVVLALAFLVPLLGWFAILPIATFVGAGATTLSILGARRGADRPARGAEARPAWSPAGAPADPDGGVARRSAGLPS